MKNKQLVETKIRKIVKEVLSEETLSSAFYSGELNKLDPSNEYGVKVMFSDSNGKTKYMSLNAESIPLIIKFFKKFKV